MNSPENNSSFEKNDVAKIINKSTDYQELYDNALDVLGRMEKELSKLGDGEYKDVWENISTTSGLDGKLNTSNPINVFEKKAKGLLERSKDIAEKSKIGSIAVGLLKVFDARLSDESKQLITDELRKTRETGSNTFFKDVDEEINKKKVAETINIGKEQGNKLFFTGAILHNINALKQQIKSIDTNFLMLSTFNIENGSSAYEICYTSLKGRLHGENLFNYIEQQDNSEALKYSALKSLFSKRKTNDLYKWLIQSSNSHDIYNYIKNKVGTDQDFMIAFLSSLDDMKANKEQSIYFRDIINKVEHDPIVKQAYENLHSIDNADVFKQREVQGLFLYDNEGNGGGNNFFSTEIANYRNQGYGIQTFPTSDGYSKYILQKGNINITMIKLNTDSALTREQINDIAGNTKYNLFTMRGHCHNTNMMINALGNRITEGSILIDGGCRNALHTSEYYQDYGVKGHIFAYTGEGRGASTKGVTDKIIQAVSEGKQFSDVLDFYNNLQDDQGDSGYFASHSERPDSLVSQYKKLLPKNKHV